MDYFYTTMTRSYPQKLAVGGAWPGFNDTRASWSQNRHMNPRCGRTLEESLQMFRRYYDASRPLPFLMIETWNDYEEGTNVEGAGRGAGLNRRTLSYDHGYGRKEFPETRRTIHGAADARSLRDRGSRGL